MSNYDDESRIERLEMAIETLEADRKRLEWMLAHPGSTFKTREEIDKAMSQPKLG